MDEQTGTVLKIAWSNGNLLEGEVTSTQASATVTRCGEDIADEYAENTFNWTRDSGNIEADAVWSAAHAGMKSVTFAAADIDGDVKISCTLTASSASYGSITVDDDMDASHTPAELDANDVFVIENGDLKVTTSRGNAYVLENGRLKAAGAKLNGSITAQTKLFASQPESIVEFAYNHNKLRTQKKVTKADGTVETTDYTLHGKLLTHLTKGEDEMHFFYDAQSRPAMVEFNGALYSYIHNLQGDIVGIVDSNGNLVVEYAYDAWGRHLAVGNVTAAYAKLAILNPFRYRGYVYDEETGLYYLRGRYYDSSKGRFVNADAVVEELIFANVYVYCQNRPITRIDENGGTSTKVSGSALSLSQRKKRIKEQLKLLQKSFANDPMFQGLNPFEQTGEGPNRTLTPKMIVQRHYFVFDEDTAKGLTNGSYNEALSQTQVFSLISGVGSIVAGAMSGVASAVITMVSPFIRNDLKENVYVNMGVYTTQVVVFEDETVEGTVSYVAKRTISIFEDSPLNTDWEVFSMYDTDITEELAIQMCIL